MKANIWRTYYKNDYDEKLEKVLNEKEIQFDKEYIGSNVEYSILIKDLSDLLIIGKKFDAPIIIDKISLTEMNIVICDRTDKGGFINGYMD